MNYEVLTGCALFRGIPAGDLPGAVACIGGAAKAYPAGGFLLREGEATGRIGVVLAGSAEVVHGDADGNRSVQTVLQPGDLFAETFAAARLAALPVSVTAREGCEALLFPYQRLLQPAGGCAHHTRLLQNLLGALAQKNLVLNSRLAVLGHRSLRGKLTAYLAAQSEAANSRTFTIPLDRQGLADYLCADRSAVSAELSRMRRDGLVDYRRSRFTLLWQADAAR